MGGRRLQFRYLLTLCALSCMQEGVAAHLGAPRLGIQEPAVPTLPDRMPAASAKTVRYEMEVSLDPFPPSQGTIRATSRVTWTNPTQVSTRELYWHVYNNAWADRDSLWLREARLFGNHAIPERWGRTDVDRIRFLELDGQEMEGQELSWAYEPYPEGAKGRPGAANDRTVLRAVLPDGMEVAGGSSITVEIVFATQLPTAFRRSGSDNQGEYIHAVQWYPKLGVFEQIDGETRWNCEPYHYLTEYYADYGDYSVALTLPEMYRDKVAASGSQQGEAVTEGGSVRYQFEAQDIHDFAWTADPDFLVYREPFRAADFQDEEEELKVAAALGRPLEQVVPGDTEMILFLQPEHEEYKERYLNALAQAIYYFGLWYGTYPYETISLIDPAANARATGGMEYPRLITGGARKGVPSRVLRPEGVTVHEFGHQYWYGLVGNDEFRYAWLDEGLNTFATQRILQKAWPVPLQTYEFWESQHYGRSPMALPEKPITGMAGLLTLQGFKTPSLEIQDRSYGFGLELRRRTSLERWFAELPPLTYWQEVTQDPVLALRNAFQYEWADPMGDFTYGYLNWGMRSVNAYRRPALTLETLSRLMGETRWIRTMRYFHENWRFKHPRPNDFLAALLSHGAGTELMGDDGSKITLNWEGLWRQLHDENKYLDFAVHRLVNQKTIDDVTVNFGAPDPGDEESEFDPGEGETWDVIVEVMRKGQVQVPVEIRVVWEDGTKDLHVWDGKDHWWRWRSERSTQRAVQVVVDPFHRLALDKNLLNNSRSAKPQTDRVQNVRMKTFLWVQQVLHYFGGVG